MVRWQATSSRERHAVPNLWGQQRSGPPCREAQRLPTPCRPRQAPHSAAQHAVPLSSRTPLLHMSVTRGDSCCTIDSLLRLCRSAAASERMLADATDILRDGRKFARLSFLFLHFLRLAGFGLLPIGGSTCVGICLVQHPERRLRLLEPIKVGGWAYLGPCNRR